MSSRLNGTLVKELKNFPPDLSGEPQYVHTTINHAKTQ